VIKTRVSGRAQCKAIEMTVHRFDQVGKAKKATTTKKSNNKKRQMSRMGEPLKHRQTGEGEMDGTACNRWPSKEEMAMHGVPCAHGR
jgi:hypothetical protein